MRNLEREIGERTCSEHAPRTARIVRIGHDRIRSVESNRLFSDYNFTHPIPAAVVSSN
jgi:hypothetical protein